MSSLIQLEQVSKCFESDGVQRPVLNQIHFQLQAGEMTAIVGKSGSGKSTLMNILGLLDHCTAGRYLFAGRDVSGLSDDELAKIRNQQIGFVFQSFFLLPRLSALDNVMLPLFYRGLDRHTAKQQAVCMLEKMGLHEKRHQLPSQLSGGQQQRVAIARALVGNPTLILADEPTGALDSQTSQEIMALLLGLNREEGRTILIITHDHAISSQCRRVIRIHDGCLLEHAS